jgi:hypothetical protein
MATFRRTVRKLTGDNGNEPIDLPTMPLRASQLN